MRCERCGAGWRATQTVLGLIYHANLCVTCCNAFEEFYQDNDAFAQLRKVCREIDTIELTRNDHIYVFDEVEQMLLRRQELRREIRPVIKAWIDACPKEADKKENEHEGA